MLALSSVALSGCDEARQGTGPFGTAKGMTAQGLRQFAVLEHLSTKDGRTTYLSSQAPDTSGYADSYYYVIGSTTGLCAVSAAVNNMRTSPGSILHTLTEKYGLPVKDESAPWGVIWSADQYTLDEDLESIRVVFSGAEPEVGIMIQANYISAQSCR